MRKFIKKIKHQFRPLKNVIISEVQGDIELYSNQNICVFCHYDAEGLVDDYIVNILTSIKNHLNCSIIFVSNGENLQRTAVEKIKGLVSLCIVKSNVGYDYDAFKVGFSKIEDIEKFSTIYFINDSFYAPFTSFADTATKMKNHDIWGITDSLVPIYHIQSYFIALNLNERTLPFLKNYWADYKTLHCKHEVVTSYEIGISQKALAAGLNLGAYCSHTDVINTEKAVTTPDAIEQELGKDFTIVEQYLESKIKNMKDYGLSAKGSSRKKLYRKRSNEVDNPCLTSWYTLMKYHKCPVLKIRLLRDPAFFKYHYFNHELALKELYPEFDAGMIHKHLQRVGMK